MPRKLSSDAKCLLPVFIAFCSDELMCLHAGRAILLRGTMTIRVGGSKHFH